eukprot:GHVU01065050.1.p2 GENE.GHVU01065050.1~~GHVU01065050.1.p2  ORF type:complete len:100 (+),score=3.11 GHVU01065050.1:636-935(+)
MYAVGGLLSRQGSMPLRLGGSEPLGPSGQSRACATSGLNAGGGGGKGMVRAKRLLCSVDAFASSGAFLVVAVEWRKQAKEITSDAVSLSAPLAPLRSER